MKNLLKLVKIKKKRCITRIKIPYNPYNLKKIRTIRTFRTMLGLQNKKSVQSVQSVHFGHPVYGLQNLSLKQRLNSFRIHFVTVQFFLKSHPISSLC